MIKKYLMLPFVAALSITTAFANPCRPCCQPFWSNLYLGIEGGASVSTRMNFKPDINEFRPTSGFTWALPASGEFPDDMNTSGMWGINLGCKLNPVVSVDLDYSQRSGFKWDKQFALAPIEETVGEIYKLNDIRVKSLIVDVNLAPAVCWCGIRPFAQAGIGAAWNKTGHLANFDLGNSAGTILPSYDTVVEGDKVTNFAWKIGAGVDYACVYDTRLHFILGYRFMDVGKLRTGTHIEDPVFGIPTNVAPTIQAFKADHVQLNEVYVGATYHFS